MVSWMDLILNNFRRKLYPPHPTEGLPDAEGEPAAPRGLVKHFPDLVQFPTTRAAPASGGGGGDGLGGGGGGLRTPAAHSKQRSTTRSAHGLD